MTEPRPQNELALLLWVVATLFASFVLTWWFFDLMYT
jgi:hypothetical protein